MTKQLIGEHWLTSPNKRRFDLLIAYGTLVPALAVTALAASAIYIETPRTPIFKQPRPGRAGVPFDVYKIRTMERSDYNDAGNGHADSRATRIGRLLRGPGLDELPQLINVLKGDMSIVGPRPLPFPDINEMQAMLSPSEFNDWLRACQTARPGIVSMFGNASRSLVPQTEEYLRTRAEMDIDYCLTATPALDRKIISEALALGVRKLTHISSLPLD